MTASARGPVAVRPVQVSDAAQLVDALTASQTHLAGSFSGGWSERLDIEVQSSRIARALERTVEGTSWPGVVTSASGEVLGRTALDGIVGDNRLSCFLSYWLREDACGYGYATTAVRFVLDVAFDQLGLHRVEAFVRPSNAASLALEPSRAFERIGVARRQTFVGSDWQDEVLAVTAGLARPTARAVGAQVIWARPAAPAGQTREGLSECRR